MAAASLATAALAFIVLIALNGQFVRHHQSYETGVGQQMTVRLDDGSILTLNTHSKVLVNYRPHARLIDLKYGEALFTVSKNRSRPFVVSAGQTQARAVGTEFSVRKDDDRTVITTIEGSIAVDEKNNIWLNKTIAVLYSGDQITSFSGGYSFIGKADLRQATSWVDGKIIFDDVSMASAVSEFNRYSYKPIIIGDPRLASRGVSGVFKIKSVDSFLILLSKTYGVELTEQQGAYFLGSRVGAGPPRSLDHRPGVL